MSASPDDDLEKRAGVSFSPAETPGGADSSHHYRARARERLRHFLHPNGRRVHIVADPVEADRLRERLQSAPDSGDFDIYISGTEQHLEALRHAHTHHEGRRRRLQERHAEVYEQFADVQGELDALNVELNRVTDHGVSMDAHFDRFGYSAHIRSYDDEDSPAMSGSTTPNRRNSSSSRRGGGSAAEKGFAAPLKLFQTPVMRQYFHKGILWRASSSEEVQSFELFVDLLYVGIIAINGDAASEEPTGLSLLRFVITFTLSWKIWNDMALIISWFENDDMFSRFSILFLLACLFGYTTNITEAFGETYPTLIGFYLAARLYMVAYLVLVAYLVPMVRGTMVLYVGVAMVGVALWIGSIHVEYPYQLALIWIALFFDLTGHTPYVFGLILSNRIGGRFKTFYDKAFEFTPALNIEHRTERTNAFVTLVFGYTVVAILYQSAVNGVDTFFGKGILGLVQAFCYNWIYFEIDGSNLLTHAIRRHKMSAFAWGMAHLPFIMAFVLGGGALARLVVARDTFDADLESLTPAYQARSEPEIAAGIRWFYCGGFGVALMCMAIISISHVHKETQGLRLRKRYRLVLRFGVAVVMICLPLAESLSSLSLVGTVTGLVVFLLLCELWACSCAGAKLWQRDKPCRYIGHCGKKDLAAYVHAGKELDLGELGKSSKLKDSGLDGAPL